MHTFILTQNDQKCLNFDVFVDMVIFTGQNVILPSLAVNMLTSNLKTCSRSQKLCKDNQTCWDCSKFSLLLDTEKSKENKWFLLKIFSLKHMMVLCVTFPRSDCPVSNSRQSRPKKKQPKITLVAEIFASLNNAKICHNILKLQGSKVILSNLTVFWSWVPFSTF